MIRNHGGVYLQSENGYIELKTAGENGGRAGSALWCVAGTAESDNAGARVEWAVGSWHDAGRVVA